MYHYQELTPLVDRKTARKRWLALTKQVYETDPMLPLAHFGCFLLDQPLKRAILRPIVKKQVPIPFQNAGLGSEVPPGREV